MKRKRLYGTGKVYKRGKIWYVALPGETPESTGKTARAEAEFLLAERTREKAAGTLVSKDIRTISIGELVLSLLSELKGRNQKDTKSRWEKHLAPFFGNMKAVDLGTTAMKIYRVRRLSEGVVDTTINRELQVIRRAYKLAAECDPPKVQRVPRFKFPSENGNARKVFIDLPTQEKLKVAAAEEGLWARVWLEFLFSFGWRKGEIFNLTPENIDFQRGVVGFGTSKNGDGREAPLTPALRVLLEAAVAGKKPTEPFFPIKDYRWAWKRICKRAGVQAGKNGGIVPHDARRSSARNKRASGVPTSVIMNLHGWRSEQMFLRYGIVDNADKAVALDQEADWVKEQLQKISAQKSSEEPN
ncbi:MAG: tyrosine-type recombinase/integrase [Candidatus Sulfotelmatobacter sp.]